MSQPPLSVCLCIITFHIVHCFCFFIEFHIFPISFRWLVIPAAWCWLFTHVHMKDSGEFGHLCIFRVSLHDPHLVTPPIHTPTHTRSMFSMCSISQVKRKSDHPLISGMKKSTLKKTKTNKKQVKLLSDCVNNFIFSKNLLLDRKIPKCQKSMWPWQEHHLNLSPFLL